MADKTFINGLIFKRLDKAPEFIIGGLSIKKSEFIPFLESQDGDWVNVDIKLSKGGKYYIELNTWKPNNNLKPETQQKIIEVTSKDDLPF